MLPGERLQLVADRFGDRVLVIMQNGYTSATGAQFIPNTAGNRRDGETTSDIAATLKEATVRPAST